MVEDFAQGRRWASRSSRAILARNMDADDDLDVYDDAGERTASELEDVHTTVEEILATLKSRSDLSGWIWLIIFVFLLNSWSGSWLDRWTDKVWYSFRYDADVKNITIQKRPIDCDFFSAPMGSKGCNYNKRTNIFGDEQRRVFVQQATTQEEKNEYERQPNSVSVYWEKEKEEE